MRKSKLSWLNSCMDDSIGPSSSSSGRSHAPRHDAPYCEKSNRSWRACMVSSLSKSSRLGSGAQAISAPVAISQVGSSLDAGQERAGWGPGELIYWTDSRDLAKTDLQ